jgi:hypothetical protein
MAVAEVTTHKKTRIVSVVAATAISLACGTNVSCHPLTRNQLLTPAVCLLSMGSPIRGQAATVCDTEQCHRTITHPHSISNEHDLIITLGHGCEPWNVRIGYTNGYNHRSEESSFGRLDRHDMSVRWVLSNPHRYGSLQTPT